MVLIGINIGVWLLVLATGWRTSPRDRLAVAARARPLQRQRRPGLVPRRHRQGHLSGIPASGSPGSPTAPWWQLITSTFLHVDVWHIGFNMLALWFLGPQLEMAIGRARFLALYLLSGLAGSAWSTGSPGEQTSTLGASGAVYGLMGALLVLAFKVGGQVQTILIWIGINVVFTFVGGFSWQGHLGGFLGGAAIMALLVYAPRERRTPVQVGGLVLITLLVLGAIAARTLVLV